MTFLQTRIGKALMSGTMCTGMLAASWSMVCAQTSVSDAVVAESNSLSPALMAHTSHAGRLFPSPYTQGSAISVEGIDIPAEGNVIVVRYLGYRCAHCVRQLRYLNEYANQLAKAGITVLAISEDPEMTSKKLMSTENLDPRVFSVISDVDNSIAKSIGAYRESADSIFDLHSTITVSNGNVQLSVFSEQPFMDIERIVGSFPRNVDGTAMLVGSTHAVDKYIGATTKRRTIASNIDGVRTPIDLDFNKGPLHPNDLWVVTDEGDDGNGMIIVHDAGQKTQSTRYKKDSRANHFMFRTQAIAMGNNGTFGTAENGLPVTYEGFYVYMGPTLWSSDTAVFASRYQAEQNMLASHLDMLHHSPMCVGMAFDQDNKFWILDEYYGDICSYDFQDPHEVGGTDHRDGIVHTYTGVNMTPRDESEKRAPAHIDLDRRNGWLYFVDPGKKSVRRLNTITATRTKTLALRENADEFLKDFAEFGNADVQTVISTGLESPVGLHVVDNRLLVGDRKTGLIHIYDLDDNTKELGTVATNAQELLGITVGPDGRIWYVDREGSTVCRLDVGATNSVSRVTDVKAVKPSGDVVTFSYTNTSSEAVTPNLVCYMKTSSELALAPYVKVSSFQTEIPAYQTKEFTVPVTIAEGVSVQTYMIRDESTESEGGMSTYTMAVPNNLKKVIVEDAPMEVFSVQESVEMTNHKDYSSLRSDIFDRVADSLTKLTTVLWNGGSFGEISVTDDVILQSLLNRGVEVMLIADDPLVVRGDLPGQLTFNNMFGFSLGGAEYSENPSASRRMFTGRVGDTITAGMTEMEATLPRLDHYRGGLFVPNIKLRPKQNAVGILYRTPVQSDTMFGAVRFETPTYRTVTLSVNASRFTEADRIPFLDKSLTWLEAYAAPEIVDTTTTSVDESATASSGLSLHVSSNPVMDIASVQLRTNTHQHVRLSVFSITGQELAVLHDGMVDNSLSVQWNADNLATGTYFLIARTESTVQHLTVQHQNR